MVVYLWEFEVQPGREAAFEAAYGAEGAWVALFRHGEGYLGTELLRAAEEPRRYLTLDRWTAPEAFARFRQTYAAEYEALDASCEELTRSERALGSWNLPA